MIKTFLIIITAVGITAGICAKIRADSNECVKSGGFYFKGHCL